MRVDATDENFIVLYLDADGPIVATSNDTSDLIGNAWSENASLIALPVSRLDPEFFNLSSLIAGGMLQKLVNYRLRLAIVGDISEYLAASDALQAFVWESNRGEHVWFVDDEAELAGRLGR